MKRISTEGKKVSHTDFSYQAKQWDYERNSNPPEWALSHEKLVFVGSSETPYTTKAGSNKFAFWRCPEGPDHRWYAQINSRCGGQSGCPFCSSNRANTDGRLRTVFSVTVTLEGNNEYMSLEWDPIANNGVLPREVPLKHSVSRSWRCPNSPDHVWATAPGNRNLEDNETECPVCPSDYHDNKEASA